MIFQNYDDNMIAIFFLDFLYMKVMWRNGISPKKKKVHVNLEMEKNIIKCINIKTEKNNMDFL